MFRPTPRTAPAAVGGRRGRPAWLAAATAVALAATVATTATACSGDDDPPPIPAAEAFEPGACRELAPALVDTMRITRADHEGPGGLERLADELIPPQERLYDQVASAGPHATAVERVTTAIGWLRFRVAAGTYEPALLTEVTTASDALADRCT